MIGVRKQHITENNSKMCLFCNSFTFFMIAASIVLQQFFIHVI